MMRGRTVGLLVALSIMLSSLVTVLAIDSTPQHLASTHANVSFKQKNQAQTSPEISVDVEQKFTKIKEAFEIIRNNYVFEVDEERLLEGAIEGMLNTLEDPYSVYMNPEVAEQFKSSLQSSFEGIGAEVTMQNGRVTIVAPIRGSPAEKAGLRPNDQILSVDGENLEGLDIQQAVMKIRGPKGSKATLVIQRPELAEPITITVIRGEIPLETVYAELLEVRGKKIGKIELTSFAQKTAEQFASELKRLESQGMQGLIIDVRGNPGGYLDAVEEIGKLLVPNESIITEIQNREGNKLIYRSTLKEPKPYPITILIDDGSASASEILASALQEAGGYKVIGVPSFGKGTVQSTVQMADNSEIKITIAKWLTPKENWIHEKGVQPDIFVEQPEFFRAAPIQTNPPLREDMNSEAVRNLQVILQALGYDPGRQDGFFSTETKQAVIDFQKAHQLKPTGVVDEKTAVLMQDKIIELIRDPKHDRQLQRAIEHIVKEIK